MRIRTHLPIAAIALVVLGCETERPSSESQPTREPAAAPSLLPPPAATPASTPALGLGTPPAQPTNIAPPDDVAAPPKDAKQTKSGLYTKLLTKGTGSAKPKPADSVKVHYTGWTRDGKMFDSSVPRGQPATFGVDQVIKGWTEALQLMTVGEKRRLWIPADLAYGDTPRTGAPGGQLTFDVELVEIIEAPKPLPAPPDVAKPSAGSKKTESGLAYKVLKKGTGKAHPKASDRVTVHYTGWTQDGKMFDSSVVRGQPTTFPLNGVIRGWTEGVQLMVEGEKVRFWIPAELAYGDTPRRPGAPSGPLTFDVELISISGTP
jgi:FKBP-type peptidyl-prolyl cis-trans isomerase